MNNVTFRPLHRTLVRRRLPARLAVATLAAAAALLSGCMTVELTAARVDVPVSMTSELGEDYRTVGHFREDTHAWFAVGQMFTIINPRIERQIERQLQRENGDAIVNLRITGTNTFWDYLAPLLVGGATGLLMVVFGDQVDPADATLTGLAVASLLSRRTYRIEGDVARF